MLRATLPRIRPGFLLYVGGVDYRKNIEGTIRGYAELPESVRDAHQLVIACRIAGSCARLERSLRPELGISPRDLLLTGFVTDEQLAALYRSCELFIFPSLYEGAGLPILEAMSCGAPVAASRTTSVPELLGDLEATFDPADPADIAPLSRRGAGQPGAPGRAARALAATGPPPHVGAGGAAHTRRLRASPGDSHRPSPEDRREAQRGWRSSLPGRRRSPAPRSTANDWSRSGRTRRGRGGGLGRRKRLRPTTARWSSGSGCGPTPSSTGCAASETTTVACSCWAAHPPTGTPWSR